MLAVLQLIDSDICGLVDVTINPSIIDIVVVLGSRTSPAKTSGFNGEKKSSLQRCYGVGN